MGSCCCANRGYSKLDDPEFRTFPSLRYLSNNSDDRDIYCRQYPLQLVESNNNTWESMRHFKIVFLGESAVGKSSIIQQKISYKFDIEYQQTIEDYYVKVHRLNVDDYDIDLTSFNDQLNINSSLTTSNNNLTRKGSNSFSTRYDKNGKNYNDLQCFHCILDIQDTSGSLDLRQNINQWIWRSQVFVIVFDITNNKTFIDIENSFISRIIDLRKCQQPPIILVGNKSDLTLIHSQSKSPKMSQSYTSNTTTTR